MPDTIVPTPPATPLTVVVTGASSGFGGYRRIDLQDLTAAP